MNLIDRLEALENAPLGKARLDKLKEIDSPELRDILNYSLSPYITFGMKQVPHPTSIDCSLGSNWWPCLKPILDCLAERSLTGNNARNQVTHFLNRCSECEQKWTERIIKQDLRLSIGVTAINKVLPGTIAKFEVPLAVPYKDLKSPPRGVWMLQPKFDGGRCVSHTKNGKTRLLSRTGMEWGPSFEPIRAAIEEWVRALNRPGDVYTDGELVIIDKHGRMDFNATQRIFAAKDGRKPNGKLMYFMFDYAEGNEYISPSLIYRCRFDDLIKAAGAAAHSDIIKLTTFVEVYNPKYEFLIGCAECFVAELGCDGAIIRNLEAIPKNKRTRDLVKIKPFEDGEATIIGKVEGTGWLEGSLGALECELDNGIKFNLGTGEGLTKDLRKELWEDPNLLGSKVNFKYLRLSNDGVPINITYRAIRHPYDM